MFSHVHREHCVLRTVDRIIIWFYSLPKPRHVVCEMLTANVAYCFSLGKRAFIDLSGFDVENCIYICLLPRKFSTFLITLCYHLPFSDIFHLSYKCKCIYYSPTREALLRFCYIMALGPLHINYTHTKHI